MLGVDIFVSKLFCRAGMVVDLPAVCETQVHVAGCEARVKTWKPTFQLFPPYNFPSICLAFFSRILADKK